jgi:hypothetical protein
LAGQRGVQRIVDRHDGAPLVAGADAEIDHARFEVDLTPA